MFLRLVPLSCIQNICGSGLNVGNKLEDSEREEGRPRHAREAEGEKRAVGTSSCSDQGMRAVHTVKNLALRDFPGGPVVKTLPSNAGGVGSIPGLGTKIPHASQPKNQNIKKKNPEAIL